MIYLGVLFASILMGYILWDTASNIKLRKSFDKNVVRDIRRPARTIIDPGAPEVRVWAVWNPKYTKDKERK